MTHVDEKRQPEVILDWCLQANARFQLPLARVFGVPGGLSATRTLHPFWGNFRVGGHPLAYSESCDPNRILRSSRWKMGSGNIQDAGGWLRGADGFQIPGHRWQLNHGFTCATETSEACRCTIFQASSVLLRTIVRRFKNPGLSSRWKVAMATSPNV